MKNLFLYKRHKNRRTNFSLKPSKTPEVKNKKEENIPKYICCYICLQPITTEDEKIQINGSFQHTFLNPSNIEYTIGCFRSAPGCEVIGKPTYEHTWFASYAWQIAVCGNCGEHLGWKYTSNNNPPFWGLIIAKLTYFTK